jgi:hypothetical protein
MATTRDGAERALELALRRAEQELDAMLGVVLRLRGGVRAEAERALDEARGLCNRARARLEELRLADDDGFGVLRPRAAAAVDALASAVAALRRTAEAVAA